MAKTFDYLHQMLDDQAYFAGCVGRLHNDCLPYRRANREGKATQYGPAIGSTKALGMA
jgi:hypothetical protein